MGETAKITHEAHGEKQTITFSAKSNIYEYLTQIERLLAAASFLPATIKEGFLVKAAEIEEEKLKEINLDTNES